MNKNYFSFNKSRKHLRLLLIGVIAIIVFYPSTTKATIYYYQGGVVTTLASWNTLPGGGGATPPNFTTAGNQFNFRNNGNAKTLDAAWTVSGAGSGVTIGDGVVGFNLTIPAGANLLTGSILNVFANSTLTITNNTNLKPTLTGCTFDATSSCIYNNSASTTVQVPVGSTYGKLVISGTGGAGTTYTMNGALTIGTLSLTTAPTLELNTTATNRIFTIGNYFQSAGTLDGGTSNTGDANFTVYVDITTSFNKTGGSTDNLSPSQYTCFEYTGNVTETFSTAGTDNYMFVHVVGTTSLTLNSALTLNGASAQSKTTFTLDAGATITCGTNLITNGSTGTSTNLINGTFQTAAPTGFSGGAATAIKSTNGPTITMGAASTVEYNAGVAQTVTTRTDYANVTISNNSIKTMGGANTLSGNLTINATATLAAGNFTHKIAGDFLNSGIFTSNNSTINMNGGAAQNIGPAGGSITTFHNLQISNTSGDVTLQQDANVSITLTMSNGLLNTSAAGTGLITMQVGSTTGASKTDASTSYINGPMMYQITTTANGSTTVNFPIGASPDCRPITLTVSHKVVTQYNYLAQVNNSPASFLGYTLPATVDTASGVHYWTIDRTDVGGTSQPNLDLNGNQTVKFYFGSNDKVYQGANLTIIKNVSGGTQWFDIGGSSLNPGGGPWVNSGAPQAGSVTSTSSPNAFNSFSTFTLGSLLTGWNSLPIELLSFTAVPNNERVDIKWSTSTETNNDYFTIEKSKDGRNFTKLIDVKGAGNSTSLKEYFDIDPEPYVGTSYYRLKQTDKNGAYKYFYMIPVTFNGNKNITLFPNPIGKGEPINIKVTGYPSEEVLVVLRDMSGKEFSSKVLVTEESDHIFSVSTLTEIPAGVYMVVASSNNKIYSYKLVVR
jgi:hypothetical protein